MPDSAAEPVLLTLPRIAELLFEEEGRAADVLHLTANETVLSPLARRALASPLGSRYLLEHLEMRRDSPSRLGNLLYRGLDGVNAIESSATLVCERLFGARYAEFRCISGLHAMQTTFAALTKPGDMIMRVATQDGGHFLTELICRSFGRRSCTYSYSGIGELDLDRTEETFRREQPALLYIDAMNYLFPLPLKELRAIVGRTPIVFDASHTLGLIAGGQFPNPLAEGADILQANTHKTLPGPQKGIILGNDRALMERIGYLLSNGVVSSQHTASTIALFIALHEMLEDGERYAARVLHLARALAAALDRQGVAVLGADRGYTANHVVFVDARPYGSGLLVLERLLRADISANRLIPFAHVDAIRLGVQEIARRGYTDEDVELIASWFRRLLVEREDPERVRPEVTALVRSRTEIRYTGLDRHPLPAEVEEALAFPPLPRASSAAAEYPVRSSHSAAHPRWIEVALEPAAAPPEPVDLAHVRELGRVAGAFEHQVDSAGNISIVDAAGRLFVTASGAYIRDLKDDDLVEVGGLADWTLRCRGAGPPSTEAYLHHLLAERVGARCVVHNHYIPPGSLEHLGVAVIPPKEYGSVELAEAAVETALSHQIFYVRRHGLVFWSTDFAECRELIMSIAEITGLVE